MKLRMIRGCRRTDLVAGKRRRCSADFKAKVALQSIRGEATLAERVKKHRVHQTLIGMRRRKAMTG